MGKYKEKEARIPVDPADALIAAALADLVSHAVRHELGGAEPVIARIQTVLELVASERAEAVTLAVEASRKRGGLDANL